ncbi:hypothetical protein AALC25_01235 [Lachnospiraceae bacterium 29-84]
MLIVLDVILLLYGVYTIYSSVKMKQTQQLSSWLMGNETAASIRDVRGYINYVYTRIIVMGAVAILFAAAGFYNDLVAQITEVIQGMMLLFLTVTIWFYFSIRKAKQMFW